MMSSNAPKRRVVITGMGAVTPLGPTMASTWQGILEGRCVAAPVQSFDGSLFSSQVAYEVRDFSFDTTRTALKADEAGSRVLQFGLHAGLEALHQAKLQKNQYDPYRTAVCLGVGIPSPSYGWYRDHFGKGVYELNAYRNHMHLYPDQLAALLGPYLDARGGLTTVHTACASSGQSIGEAYEMIAYNDCDLVLTGGSDGMVSPFYFSGFGLLGALSKRNQDPQRASRPFDKDRDGFVLGEGSCLLVLESYEHALARGAIILGEVCGYGVTESAYRITDLHPEGIGPIEAMQGAIEDAGLDPQDIGYLNAHGTSTQVNDKVEALAIRKVFGDHDLYVSSSKSMTGHLISAAGAIELAICTLALRDQILPPSLNVFEQDPECQIRLTPAQAEPSSLRYALSNSVGFGGSNTALVVGKGNP